MGYLFGIYPQRLIQHYLIPI